MIYPSVDRGVKMENNKQYRSLEIFYRGLRGEALSVQNLANEYGVSTKSITRSINELKDFLADHRDLVGGKVYVWESGFRVIFETCQG